ncbi:MAG: hypothetical protein KDJ19_12285 [Hyphomicrobiaceae bacterium]|nr:hypothetical protein [Hyphomicrobiaceae bacterium]MCC0024234.1 hypothetical protein [Hyphomicrobiaceae bacterium]
MTSAAPQKFTFDLDFAARGTKRQRVVAEADLNAMLKEAEQRGYARGLSEGENSAIAQAAKGLDTATNQLVARSAEAIRRSDALVSEITRDATDLAVAVARKLSGAVIDRYPLDEIRELLRECLLSLDNAPHLVIRCHPDLANQVQKLAEAQIATSGFTGRLVIMGEPEIGLADARFEWVDGGLVRSLDQINSEIDERVAAFIGPDPDRASATPDAEPAPGLPGQSAVAEAPRPTIEDSDG